MYHGPGARVRSAHFRRFRPTGVRATSKTRRISTVDSGNDARRSPLQEVANAFGNLASMRFQGEMAGVEEADHRARIVPLERLGAGRQKERVVLAPHRQERRLALAEIFLE